MLSNQSMPIQTKQLSTSEFSNQILRYAATIFRIGSKLFRKMASEPNFPANNLPFFSSSSSTHTNEATVYKGNFLAFLAVLIFAFSAIWIRNRTFTFGARVKTGCFVLPGEGQVGLLFLRGLPSRSRIFKQPGVGVEQKVPIYLGTSVYYIVQGCKGIIFHRALRPRQGVIIRHLYRDF